MGWDFCANPECIRVKFGMQMQFYGGRIISLRRSSDPLMIHSIIFHALYYLLITISAKYLAQMDSSNANAVKKETSNEEFAVFDGIVIKV